MCDFGVSANADPLICWCLPNFNGAEPNCRGVLSCREPSRLPEDRVNLPNLAYRSRAGLRKPRAPIAPRSLIRSMDFRVSHRSVCFRRVLSAGSGTAHQTCPYSNSMIPTPCETTLRSGSAWPGRRGQSPAQPGQRNPATLVTLAARGRNLSCEGRQTFVGSTRPNRSVTNGQRQCEWHAAP
jgi:hypothetical protein